MCPPNSTVNEFPFPFTIHHIDWEFTLQIYTWLDTLFSTCFKFCDTIAVLHQSTIVDAFISAAFINISKICENNQWRYVICGNVISISAGGLPLPEMYFATINHITAMCRVARYFQLLMAKILTKNDQNGSFRKRYCQNNVLTMILYIIIVDSKCLETSIFSTKKLWFCHRSKFWP